MPDLDIAVIHAVTQKLLAHVTRKFQPKIILQKPQGLLALPVHNKLPTIKVSSDYTISSRESKTRNDSRVISRDNK